MKFLSVQTAFITLPSPLGFLPSCPILQPLLELFILVWTSASWNYNCSQTPWGFCFTSSSTNSQQAEARRKAWKHLNVFLCSFHNDFKYCINKSPTQCRKDHGIEGLGGKKWSKVCATLKHKTCACETLGTSSWLVSPWSQGHAFV